MNINVVNKNLKEKIKLQAIYLFNKLGISTVSMLQLAESLSISAGNLRYHYKTKALLLDKIYEDIHNDSLNFILTKDAYITLHHFEIMMLNFNSIQKKYTFFFNEIVHIARLYPTVAKRYEASSILKFKEARVLINYYIESNRVIEEKNTVDYDKLIYSIWMVSTFWQSQSQVINTPSFLINKCDYMDMQWNLLLPYLTEKGLEEYYQIKKFVIKKI